MRNILTVAARVTLMVIIALVVLCVAAYIITTPTPIVDDFASLNDYYAAIDRGMVMGFGVLFVGVVVTVTLLVLQSHLTPLTAEQQATYEAAHAERAADTARLIAEAEAAWQAEIAAARRK